MGSTGGLMADRMGDAESSWLLVLLVFATLTMLSGLDAGPPLSDHEAIVAESARQVRQTGHWVIPHFNDVPFIRKPPLQTWLAAGLSYLVDRRTLDPPVSELAARLPSALSAIVAVFCVYVLGRAMYGGRRGLVAGAIMTCCVGTLFYSHNAQAEMLLTAGITGCMTLFYLGVHRPVARDRYLIWFYVCLAVAMYAKAPMPLALVGLPLFVYWFVTLPVERAMARGESRGRLAAEVVRRFAEQLKGLRELRIPTGVLLFLAIFAPWPLYVYLRVDHALALWRTEFIDRYTGEMEDQSNPFWYYLPLVIVFTIPFCLSAPEALAAPFRRVFRRERRGLLFALTWVAVQIVFLSSSSFKRPHYLLPALPGLCLLLAPVIDRLFLRATRFDPARLKTALLLIVVLVPVGLVIGMASLYKEQPVMFWAGWRAGLIMLVCVFAATYAFWRMQRQLSLLILTVTPVLVFVWMWSALGRSDFACAEVRFARHVAQQVRDSDARVTWAVGRPDARIPYYAGMRVYPLFTPMEMASRRRGREEVPHGVLLDGADKVMDRLESGRREYFILEADELATFREMFQPRYREVLRVETEEDEPGEAYVLIMNPPGSSASTQATSPSSAATSTPSASRPARR